MVGPGRRRARRKSEVAASHSLSHPVGTVAVVDPSSLLDGLDETQQTAVTTAGNPLAILAGAGSGKTRVLTRRIAHRVTSDEVDPRRIMAVTFTRKAASELVHRLRSLGLRDSVVTGTFHSLAYSQLRQRWAERGIAAPDLLDRKFGFIARLMGRPATPLLLDTIAEVEWAAARAVDPEDYAEAARAADRSSPLPVADMVNLMQRYAEEKRRARLVDFDDLLRLAYRDLAADPDYAAALRWRHRHVFVDEFQDVNPQQFRLLNAWVGSDPDLCVVGDPNQAIYAWNGADAGYLSRFPRFYQGAEVVQLGHNYRSTPQIVAAGQVVLPRATTERITPTAHRPDGEPPLIRSYPDDQAEASGVARSVRDHHRPGTSWSDQAVLARTNAQTQLLAEALGTAGIPYRVKGGASLVDQPEIKALLSPLRRREDPLSELLEDLRADIAEAAPGESATPAERDRQRNREALLRLTADHASAEPGSTGGEFVAYLEATARSDGLDAATDAVDVTTFHAAKGLEWRVVHLAGVERGYVPIGHADGPAELSEERRLIHVAITRAKELVSITWAAQRTFGERKSARQPSPYLELISPTPEGAKKASAASDKISKLAKVKDSLGDLPVDDPLYGALVDWRKAKAKASAVPAYVVFNNKTLAAIVDIRPSSEAELLSVPGIGTAKAERYGEEVLELVSEQG